MLVTLLINVLCEKNLSAIAWIVVFLPFFLMTVVVGILLYAFGLDPQTGVVSNYVPPSTYNGLGSQPPTPTYYPTANPYSSYSHPPSPPPPPPHEYYPTQYVYPQPTSATEQYPVQPYSIFSGPPPPPPQSNVYSPPNSPYLLPPAITPPDQLTISAGWVPSNQPPTSS